MAPSAVWQYFDKTDDGSNVRCNICKKNFKYNKSTSSLSNHLKVQHKIILKPQNVPTNVDEGNVLDTTDALNVTSVPRDISEAGVFTGPLDKSFRTASAFSGKLLILYILKFYKNIFCHC